jgi:hypothetical protein
VIHRKCFWRNKCQPDVMHAKLKSLHDSRGRWELRLIYLRALAVSFWMEWPCMHAKSFWICASSVPVFLSVKTQLSTKLIPVDCRLSSPAALAYSSWGQPAGGSRSSSWSWRGQARRREEQRLHQHTNQIYLPLLQRVTSSQHCTFVCLGSHLHISSPLSHTIIASH